MIGVILALVIGKQTEYFTGSDKRPVNEVAHASQTGPATLILSGFSLGLESAAWGVAVIVAALFSIVCCFRRQPAACPPTALPWPVWVF